MSLGASERGRGTGIDASREARAELWLAAAVGLVPLLYLATDHSWAPVVWHYSWSLLAAIAVYGALYAAALSTYRLSLPPLLATVRTTLVSVTFGTIAAFLFAEGVLALVDDRPSVTTQSLRGYAPDPDTGYVYIPNHEQRVVTLESSTRWHSNSMGLRADREYGEKPPGTFRILALGDSFTVNTAVEANETWPGVLQQRFAQANAATNVEVINAGHAGYGTRDLARWYRKYGVSLRPDLVIVAMTPNDITDNGSDPTGAFTAVDGYLAVKGATMRERRLFEHRQRWYSLHGWLDRSRVKALISSASWQADEGPELMGCREELDAEDARLHGLTEEYLLEIQALAKSQNAAMGLVLVTFREQLGPMAPGYRGEVFGRRWTDFARRHDIAVVDTYPALRAHPGQPPIYFRWDLHYTAEGSRVTGDLAFDLARPFVRAPAAAPTDPDTQTVR
ncbi:MAG: SGNH/GDSL hydrolase family protein [Gemmatimonadota bacterium]|nr:SGNH/GDSL hydrolase family protein [Gemmatimonadota bacterium]